MKKYILIIIITLLACGSGYAQFTMFEEQRWVKPYSVALTLSNPASAMIKYGGGVEYRKYRRSYIGSYYKYVGAYYGAQYDGEYRYYLRKYWKHIRNNWIYQDFFYMKFIYGEMAYDGQKFAFLGQKEERYADIQSYLGTGVGFGRRYQKGHMFFAVKGGLKADYFGDLDPSIKSLYRLFYVTGPGSIVDLNFHFGVQF